MWEKTTARRTGRKATGGGECAQHLCGECGQHVQCHPIPGERERTLARRIREGLSPFVIGQHVGERFAQTLDRSEDAGDPVDDAAAVTADVAGDCGCAARRRLGEGETPPFRERCAGHQPRRSVEIHESSMRQVAEQADVALQPERRDLLSQLRLHRAAADDAQLDVRHTLAGSGDGVDHRLEPLHRSEPPDGHHQRRRRPSTARAEPRVDAVRDGTHPIGSEPELEQFLARRRRTG